MEVILQSEDYLTHRCLNHLIVIVALLASFGAGAQMPSEGGKFIDAVQVEEAPVIDGLLDDHAWGSSIPIKDLHEVVPQEFDPPSEESVIFVVYTRDALYIGARFYDSEPDKVSAQVLAQGDFSFGDDSFTVIVV